tara:strand:+ start:3436 stop:3771 length:336 start_codon:yes stop_codon:yes gene_type:complete
MKKHYAMRTAALVNGVAIVSADLEFLCSLIECPDKEYQIPDAVDYSIAVLALTNQLAFMTEMLASASDDLSDKDSVIELTKEEVEIMNSLDQDSEDGLETLRECGISIKSN